MPILGPSTDYTDKDFDALNARLDNLIDSAFPEWTDKDKADFGNILKELFAFVADVLTKYQDNQAAEAFIGRVTQRKNILALCKLLGFTPRGNTAALVELSLTLSTALAGNTPIAARSRMKTESVFAPIIFETIVDAMIPTGSTGPVLVMAENAELRDEVFTSSGLPNQDLRLNGTPYLDDTAEVTAANGTFTQVESLLESTSSDRHFVVLVDQNDRATIRFGNGSSGVIPAGSITVAYKVGGGVAGRVDPGKVTKVEGTFTDELGNAATLLVTNPASSTPALDRQSVEEIRLLAPRSLRVQNRTVAREDYEINARRVAGVARALMLTSDQDPGIAENAGILFIVPEGGGVASDDLLEAVHVMCTETYPNTLTFDLTEQTAPYGFVNIEAIVFLAKNAKAATVDAAIRDRLTRAFAITPTTADVEAGLTVGVDFGYYLTTEDGDPGTIAWSDLFNVVRDSSGVRKVDPGPAGFLVNGTRADYEIGTRTFPKLGTVTLINGDTGLALVS
jgi:hypothetical protein